MRSKGEEGTLREAKATVYFATGNKGKYEEAAQVAKGFGIRLKQLRFNKLEIQSNNLEEIASYAARHAAEATRRPVVAEDAGLFIKALEGFPGPYSSYVYETIGYQGVLRLMDRAKTRSAYFRAVVAFCRPGNSATCFSGVVNGIVSRKARGNQGFGFDPIFIPLRRGGETFAELSVIEKNRFSHRAKAFAKFFLWFMGRQ
jgi:XTP/dITP diphosphohydrolase